MNDAVESALDALYRDAIEIYERARQEVFIERADGSVQRYAATRYKQQIEKGRAERTLVPTIANIVRKKTLGFGHLERTGRRDLMLETLITDETKPYHRLFSPPTIAIARERLAQLSAASQLQRGDTSH